MTRAPGSTSGLRACSQSSSLASLAREPCEQEMNLLAVRAHWGRTSVHQLPPAICQAAFGISQYTGRSLYPALKMPGVTHQGFLSGRTCPCLTRRTAHLHAAQTHCAAARKLGPSTCAPGGSPPAQHLNSLFGSNIACRPSDGVACRSSSTSTAGTPYRGQSPGRIGRTCREHWCRLRRSSVEHC